MQTITTYLQTNGVIGTLVDQYNMPVALPPVLTINQAATIQLRIFDGPNATTIRPASAYANIIAWNFAFDKDFSRATEVLLRVTSGISVSTDGTIVIPIASTNVQPLITDMGTSVEKTYNAELAGYTANQETPDLIIQFSLAVHNRVDPEPDAETQPVTPSTLTEAQIKALIAGGYIFRFSTDNQNWHSVQTANDKYFQTRNSAIDTAQWSGAIRLPEGVSDYDSLTNRPQIGGVTLTGNKSLSDLGIAAASSIPAVNDATITFTQGGVTKGSFTTNQSSAATIDLDVGGGGTSDYDALTNRPQIGGVTLTGNKSLSDLGIAAASSIPIVNDATITFTQGGITKGTITMNQSSAATIALDAGGGNINAVEVISTLPIAAEENYGKCRLVSNTIYRCNRYITYLETFKLYNDDAYMDAMPSGYGYEFEEGRYGCTGSWEMTFEPLKNHTTVVDGVTYNTWIAGHTIFRTTEPDAIKISATGAYVTECRFGLPIYLFACKDRNDSSLVGWNTTRDITEISSTSDLMPGNIFTNNYGGGILPDLKYNPSFENASDTIIGPAACMALSSLYRKNAEYFYEWVPIHAPVNNATITFTQGGVTKGSFTTNQSSAATIALDAGGGGTNDYDSLANRPKIGGVTLTGNKSLSDLGIAAASSIPAVNDATIIFTQGGVTKGSFTTNQSSAATIALDAGGGASDASHAVMHAVWQEAEYQLATGIFEKTSSTKTVGGVNYPVWRGQTTRTYYYDDALSVSGGTRYLYVVTDPGGDGTYWGIFSDQNQTNFLDAEAYWGTDETTPTALKTVWSASVEAAGQWSTFGLIVL